MENPPNSRPQKRARRSLLFGLIWLALPIISLSWNWLSSGPLEPMLPGMLSPEGVVLDKIIRAISQTGFVFWILSGVLCVFTAFPEPKNPRTWQGKTAVLLAILVLLIFVPSAIFLMIWYSAALR